MSSEIEIEVGRSTLCLLPIALLCKRRSSDWRGWAMVAVGVRMFLIAIAVLAVAAVAFLIATA